MGGSTTALVFLDTEDRHIIDTVIVTVLTDVMAFWYKEMEWQELAMIILLVLSKAFSLRPP